MNNKFIIEILKNYIKSQLLNRVRLNKSSLGVFLEDNSQVLVRAKKTLNSAQRINKILKINSCDLKNKNYEDNRKFINEDDETNKRFIRGEDDCKAYIYNICDKLFNAKRCGSLLFFDNGAIFNIEIEKRDK